MIGPAVADGIGSAVRAGDMLTRRPLKALSPLSVAPKRRRLASLVQSGSLAIRRPCAISL
jgi:hypothetical protein